MCWVGDGAEWEGRGVGGVENELCCGEGRLTDHPDITLDVHCGRKPTTQQQ